MATRLIFLLEKFEEKKMAGYIVELYKNIRSAEGYQPKRKTHNQEVKDTFRRRTYITFGDFDKMAISSVASFSRMRDMSEIARTWIGDRQTLLLYEIEKDNEIIYQDNEGKEGFYIKSDGEVQSSENLFIAVSILQFKESTDRTKTEMAYSLRKYRKNILTLVKEKQSEKIPVYCSIFGTLGTYGLAIVWLSDQYVEILRLINYIKGTNVKEDTKNSECNFLSLFSIFAKNNLKKELIKEKLDNVEGSAMLQVTLKSNLSSDILNRFKQDLGTTACYHSAGEHDLILRTSMKELYMLFDSGQLMDPDNNFYQDHILQTNVCLCDQLLMEDDSTFISSKNQVPISENELSEFVGQVEEQYNDLRKDFFDNFPKTAGMVDSLDLLYGDFSSKISSVSNRMWARDFGYQFLAILSVIKKYLQRFLDGTIAVPTSEILADFRDILNCYEYQIIHIAESNNLLIDTPKCHLRYTGQNNLTLYAYFGITKDVIKLCYRMQGKSRQSKITPLISVDIVPIIESTMYIDYGVPDEDRVLKLNLPMMALYNMPEYIPYLYHEIFHYVVPEDRIVRNYVKGIGLSVIAVKNLVSNLLMACSGVKDEKILEKLVSYVFLPAIYRSVCKKYDDKLVGYIWNSKDNFTIKEVNEKALDWKQYEKKLIYQLLNDVSSKNGRIFQKNIIFDTLCDLYLQKEELQEEAMNVIGQDSVEKDFSYLAEIIEKFMVSLRGLVENTKNEKKEATYIRLLRDSEMTSEELLHLDGLLQVSTALSEVASDIPMVELSNMTPPHYMISYVKIQNDLLKKTDSEPQIQDYVRIGVVIDFFIGFDKSENYSINRFDSYKEEFIQLYVGLYYSNKKADGNHFAYLKNLKHEAEQHFTWIRNAYVLYMKEYRIYCSIFKILINQVSINYRKKDSMEEIYKRIKDLKCENYYQALWIYGAEIIKSIEEFTENINKGKEKISFCKRTFHDEVFNMNIRWIHFYQRQEDFNSIHQDLKKHFNEGKLYETETLSLIEMFQKKCVTVDWDTVIARRGAEDYTYEAGGIEELCKAIEKVSRIFSGQNRKRYGSNNHDIWYRGQSSINYQLLPTAMRKYVQQHSRADSLRTFQREKYEEFKFRMDNASEKPDKIGYTVCDYLALMQHYGAPTIYMDWSENAISSLYFALESYINTGKQEEQNADDAVLFMLHPNLYNEARNQIMKLAANNTGVSLDSCMKNTIQESTNSLPNLSVEYNKDKYSMFLLGEVEHKIEIPDFESRRFGNLEDCSNKEKYLYLPLAIYSSRANARVRAQFGMFMSFNIFTPFGEKDNFDYMSLENIQKFFLMYFKDASPFMYKIVIRNNSKKQIADWLKSIGVSKHMIYPELSKIGERI